jgi:hypothetical protein
MDKTETIRIQIPPASPVNAVWIVKNLEQSVKECNITRRTIDKPTKIENGLIYKLSNQERITRKKTIDNTINLLLAEIHYYKTYYLQSIFDYYYERITI